MATLRYIDAIRAGLRAELAADPAVFVLGEDVVPGGPFGATKGLAEEFGERRVLDTPISEETVMGMAVGAAAAGYRPVLEIMFADFLTLVMNQLVNHAAKLHYMSGGQLRVPLCVRAQQGAAGGMGAHHSQSLEAWFAHVPGLVVVCPATAQDNYALLGAALTDLVPRRAFALGIAALLLVLAAYLTMRPRALFVTPVRRGWRREFTESGDTYVYTVPVARAVLGAASAAFVSALSGIGGGPFHVPVATRIARIPHRLAVPSVQVTILTLSLVVVGFHLVAGHVGPPMADVPWLGVGAVAGNPVGQWVGRRLGEGPLTRALAAGLVLIGLRTAWGVL